MFNDKTIVSKQKRIQIKKNVHYFAQTIHLTIPFQTHICGFIREGRD
jgi:hypothetical protein